MSRPVDVSDTEVLYCPTNQDQTHVIASLVGRSLGFRRVVPKIDDPELEQIRAVLSTSVNKQNISGDWRAYMLLPFRKMRDRSRKRSFSSLSGLKLLMQ